MADADTTIELLRDVREILRDQARSVAAHSEQTAIANDRLGRALAAHDQLVADNSHMVEVLVRLDLFIQKEESAQALARANLDLKIKEDRATLLKVLDRVSDAASSPLGQKLLVGAFTVLAAWGGVYFGFVSPAAPVPTTPVEVTGNPVLPSGVELEKTPEADDAPAR